MKSIALLAALAAATLAQRWDVEKVDSAGWGAAVDMRWHPDGRLFLCYSDTSGVIRLASTMDSAWSYEDLPQWRSVMPGTQAFDIDGRGTIGISYVGADNRCWFALKADTSWADIQTPFYSLSHPSTTLDTAGKPVISIQLGDTFQLVRMRDTQWVTDVISVGDSAMHPWFDASAIGAKADGAIWGVFSYSASWPSDVMFWNLYRFEARDSEVSVVGLGNNPDYAVSGVSGCLDREEIVHATYSSEGRMYLDQAQIDTEYAVRSSVKFDSLGRPQIAYVPDGGGLMYSYLDAGAWQIFDLQTTGLTALSLAIDRNSEPLIAYTNSGGVFLVHGVGVTGQSEEQREPTAFDSRLAPTVVRSVLRISVSPPAVHASLFDMTGRRVGGLHSGMNEIGGLAPGVYFVREDPQASRHKLQAVSRVVVTR